ncbi:hypothetical protein BaRGS_00021775 [Batillaria attramentaria]|uniref:L-Fucosyltransferase n=1 Tax=Batillaria attramentaria TaxID=370345 RepID=A0ABD0KIG7_9CAEN
MWRALLCAVFRPLKLCFQCLTAPRKCLQRNRDLHAVSRRIWSTSRIILALLCLVSIAFVSSFLKHHSQKIVPSCPAGTDKAAGRQGLHKRNTYLVVRLSSSLGDSLFKYTSALGLAKQHGKKIALGSDSPNPLQEIFDLRYLKRMGTLCLDKVDETPSELMEEVFRNFSDVNLFLKGDFQTWRYLIGSADSVIREELRFRRSVMEHAREVIGERTRYNSSKVPFVGIHIVTRKVQHRSFGPYDVTMGSLTLKITPSDTSIFPSLRYVMRAMDHIRLKFGQVVFLVVCEDAAWCERRMKFADIVVFRGQAPAVQLAILSLTQATILTTGPLGWWGAWLAGGYTVYPREYPWDQLHRGDGRNVSATDYFLPSWKPV